MARVPRGSLEHAELLAGQGRDLLWGVSTCGVDLDDLARDDLANGIVAVD